MYEYLNELNEIQQKAVKDYIGPSLIVAGPGAGKTRVLTYRIAHLLTEGIPAYTILALTFTNKAAREMKYRIETLVNQEVARYLWMGTFHSIFAKILRTEATRIGYTPKYTIYDTIDSKSIISGIIKELGLDTQLYKPNDVLARISIAKNNLITAKAYESHAELRKNDEYHKTPQIYNIYNRYAARCKRSDAMDFDDLLLNMNILFRDAPDILEKYKNKFHFILVDEYQDTNLSQYRIIKKLSENHRNICVVGDDAQSIYSFRGARIENILNFKNDYPEHKLFKLEQNYRSTKIIVNAANSIIEKNTNQIPKKIWTQHNEGDLIQIIRTQTDRDEGYKVAEIIYQYCFNKKQPFYENAILYRTNAQSRIIEEMMRQFNIPYKVYGGISFYQRKEIKDALAYFRLIINPKDDEALRRIINYPARGIGETSLKKIDDFANQQQLSIWEVLLNINNYKIEINTGTKNKINNFVILIKSFIDQVYTTDAYELARQIITNTGILSDLYADKTPEGISRFENIQELLNGIKEFTVAENEEESSRNTIKTLDAYIENISLLTDQDIENKDDKDSVSLMTIHAAKGLEFNNVFIVGLEENLFPSWMSVSTPQDIEEERRLFYVAVTRAKKNVYLLYTQHRYRWGTLTPCKESRFIYDINPACVCITNFNNSSDEFENDENNDDIVFSTTKYNTNKKNIYTKTNIQQVQVFQPAKKLTRINTINTKFNPKTTNDLELQDLQIGVVVEHPRFGTGKILNLEGSMPHTKATVLFENGEQKELLIKYAKLKIINS